MKVSDITRKFLDAENLVDFLSRDLKTTSEIAGVLTEDGYIKNITEGNIQHVKLNIPQGESVIGVHTHPSSSGVDISEQDILSTNPPNIEASIILCQEMFSTEWKGVCFKSDNTEVTNRFNFRILCDGSTDGPAEDRFIANPRLD